MNVGVFSTKRFERPFLERANQSQGHTLTFFEAALNHRTAALAWLNDVQHAVMSFKVAVSMQNKYVDAHRFLAAAYRHLGDCDSANRHQTIADQLGVAGGPADGPLGPIQ